MSINTEEEEKREGNKSTNIKSSAVLTLSCAEITDEETYF